MFNYIKTIKSFLKTKKIIREIYDSENLKERLSMLFGTQFKIDNASRIYAVVNPRIQNMQVEQNTIIYEFTSDGMSDKTFVETWVNNHLYAASRLIQNDILMDLLTIEIKSLGNDNFLIIFKSIYFDEYIKIIKNILKISISIIIIFTILSLIYKFFV